MTIHLLYFAAARDLAGVSRESLEMPHGCCVRELRTLLAKRHPRLHPLLERARLAVDQNYAQDEDLVPAGSEIAILPPVSGGSGSEP